MKENTFITVAILMAMFLPFTYGGCGGGGGSSSDGQVYVEESFLFDVAVDTQERLLINAVGGSVEITGSPTADSVTIEGERRVGSKTREDAEKYLDMLQVSVEDLIRRSRWKPSSLRKHGAAIMRSITALRFRITLRYI